MAPQRVSVRVETLDHVLQQNQPKSIRLVKIDVEGFEEQVFRGSEELLQRIRPEAILFELNEPGAVAPSDQPVLRLLQEYDYGFFAIPKCLFRMRLQAFQPNRSEEWPAPISWRSRWGIPINAWPTSCERAPDPRFRDA